nr:hypothetical protein [uncultured Bacteroides sp.]
MKAYTGIIKLICLLIIAPIAVWELGIKKTYDLYKENQKIEMLPPNASAMVLQKNVMPTTSESLLSNGRILQLLADSFAVEGIQIVSYTPEIIDSENDYKLYCGTLMLCGRFINIVKLTSLIEKEKLPLKISSINFEYNSNQKYAVNSITATMLLQAIEN